MMDIMKMRPPGYQLESYQPRGENADVRINLKIGENNDDTADGQDTVNSGDKVKS